MHKTIVLFFAALLALITFSFPSNVYASPENLYDTPIKVRLIPATNFTVTPTGEYEIIDIKNKSVIPFKTSAQFKYSNNSVTIVAEGKTYTSTSGYAIQEKKPNTANSAKIVSVKRAGGAHFLTSEYRGSFLISPKESGDPDNRLRLFNILDIEDYIKGVVPKEIPPSWPKEALKAQSIAARNYSNVSMSSSAYLHDTVQSQVYHGKTGEDSRTNQAISETQGIYMKHNGRLINAFFHSSSGGYTDNSENVWSGTVPYIRAVNDPYDRTANNPHNSWTVNLDKNTADAKIFPENHLSLIDLEVTNRSQAGRVQQIKATAYNSSTKQSVTRTIPASGSADGIRSALGGTFLKSTKFNIQSQGGEVKVKEADGSQKTYAGTSGMKLKKKDGSESVINYDNLPVRTTSGVEYVSTSSNTFVLKGSGNGHGLGMSQYGAYGMASQGKSYQDILKHYYTNITVGK